LTLPELTHRPLSSWEKWADVWLTFSTVFLGLFMLVSTAGTSIAMGALLLGCVMQGRRAWHLGLWRDPLVLWSLAFFAFIAIHEIVTVAAGKSPWGIIGSYGELWRLPIVLVAFALIRNRDLFWLALLTSALILAALSWLHFMGLQVLAPEFFPARRITLGFGLVVVAWMAWSRSGSSNRPWILRAISLALALTVLFAMDGRTAHVLVVFLAAWAGWIWSSPRWRWALALLLPVMVLAAAMMSKSVQSRMADTLSAFGAPPVGGQVTSSGLRKEFFVIGAQLAIENPWLGVGLSGIPEAYREKIVEKAQADPRWQPYAEPAVQRTSNLHNEYLMLWAGTGIAGVLMFLAWLALPLFTRGLRPHQRHALTGLILAFALGSFMNAWLLDFTPGHVYIVLLAWLMSERYRSSLQ
jgi:O-antigen ligase